MRHLAESITSREQWQRAVITAHKAPSPLGSLSADNAGEDQVTLLLSSLHVHLAVVVLLPAAFSVYNHFGDSKSFINIFICFSFNTSLLVRHKAHVTF